MVQLFKQPEYLHVLFNPVITHLLPVATLALLVCIACRRRAAVVVALALVFVSAAAIWPTVHYGHAGYDRVLEMSDEVGGQWLDVHMARADAWQWLFYVTAVLALAAMAAPWKWPKSATPFALVTLALALTSSVFGVHHIAHPAGKIRHREFREEEPPAAEVQKAREHAQEHEHGGDHQH